MAFIACALALTSSQAHADLYSADAAYRAKDFPRAFELFRELAELGHAESQETLAIMYVQGEGVERNNILGYAWAALALEQRSSEAARSIVDQIGPRLSETGRKTVAELREKSGKDALKKTILNFERKPLASKKTLCKFKRLANPDDFYPPEAVAKGLSGFAIIEARIFSDGHDHDPRAERLIPAQAFDGPAMLVSMSNVYAAHTGDQITGPCEMRFKVKFKMRGAEKTKPILSEGSDVKRRAEAGDPDSQLLYGLHLQNADIPPADKAHFEWFIKAAQAGNTFAQYLVGHDQLNSYRFEANEAQAIFWLDKAARGGEGDAQFDLANYYLRNASNPVNAGKAVDLLGRAVEAGLPQARFYLAALLASHPSDEVRNPKRALEVFSGDQGIYELNPIGWEIRAAAHANQGKFDEAVELEKRAVRLASSFHWNTTPLKGRLADYEARKAWVGDLLAYY
jgi:TPR repeat protein